MKKRVKLSIKILIILVVIIISIMLIAHKLKINNISTKSLNRHGEILLSIEKENLNCVTVMLTLYDDNKYELFTDYAACKNNENCTSNLKYTKSLKGTYNYNLENIITSSANANNLSFTNDNLPEYRITLGEKYINIYDSLEYVVEKNKTNKYLNELLNKLNINLNKCATKDYINK
jgi:hypothetical protein